MRGGVPIHIKHTTLCYHILAWAGYPYIHTTQLCVIRPWPERGTHTYIPLNSVLSGLGTHTYIHTNCVIRPCVIIPLNSWPERGTHTYIPLNSVLSYHSTLCYHVLTWAGYPYIHNTQLCVIRPWPERGSHTNIPLNSVLSGLGLGGVPIHTYHSTLCYHVLTWAGYPYICNTELCVIMSWSERGTHTYIPLNSVLSGLGLSGATIHT